MRIVVVDDDPDLLGLLTDGLSLYGTYEIIPCLDGASGLAMIEQHRPDCIIVDILMPGLDGYQFVAAMRGDPTTAQIPLIILSALVQEQDRIIGLLRGADAYLTKPIEFSDLVATINAATALTREQRSQIFNQRADDLLPGEA